jgi:hypothetical protein
MRTGIELAVPFLSRVMIELRIAARSSAVLEDK